MKYNKEEITKSFTKYINACTVDEKNNIIEKELYQFLVDNIQSAQYKYYQNIDQELTQELLVHLISYTLPRLDLNRILAAQNLIYQSLCNKIKANNQVSKYKLPKSSFTYHSDYTEFDKYQIYTSTCDDFDLEPEQQIEQQIEDIKTAITNRINYLLSTAIPDSRIYQILTLLQQHIAVNGCNVTGFKNNVLNELKITKENFYLILRSVGISGNVFRDPNKSRCSK